MDKEIIQSITEKYDYYTLWKYREKDIDIIDCLSYFIENSINLCKSNYWDKNISYDLEIEVAYNSKSNSYSFIDNGYGLNIEELINVMSINHNRSLREYGDNLKKGIFWLGRDANILCKRSSNIQICGEYNGINKLENDLVNIEIVKVLYETLKFNSGLKIDVYGCYSTDRSLNENNWTIIKKALGNKFSRYLSNNSWGTCKITFYSDLFTNSDLGRIVTNYSLENTNGAIFKLSNLKKDYNNRDLEILVDNELQKFWDEKSFHEFKFKLLNDQKLIFNDEIFLKKNVTLNAKIFILSKPDIHAAGTAIAYKNIFVYYPKNIIRNESGLYVPFNDRIKSGRWRWIRVEIDLDDLNNETNKVKLNEDKNKIIFNLDSGLSLEQLDDGITKLFKKWIPYADFIKKLSNWEL